MKKTVPVNTQIMPAGPGWRAVVKEQEGGKVVVMPLLGWFMSVEPKEDAGGHILFMIGMVAIGPRVLLCSDLPGFLGYLAPGDKIKRGEFAVFGNGEDSV